MAQPKKSKQRASAQLGARNEREARILEGVAVWAAYYRANINRFAADFLHLNLKLFQAILLVMMDYSTIFVFIASRGYPLWPRRLVISGTQPGKIGEPYVQCIWRYRGKQDITCHRNA